MFRIDKTLVSYERERFETAYTNVSTSIRSAHTQAEKQKMMETEQKQKLLEELELRLKEKLSSTEDEAKAILAAAEEKARELMSQTEAKTAGIEAQAKEKGYQDGLNAAQQEVTAQFQKKMDVLQDLMMQVGTARETMVEELEGDIIALVLDTAKKVINIKLQKDDKVFVDLVQNALSQMKREGKIIVRVSQEDYASFFSDGSAEFILNNERIKTTVIDEPLFERGDCVIESDGGTVNAGINSQLKYIELAFRSEESHIA